MPEVKLEQPLFNECVEVAKEIIPGHDDSEERRRMVVGLGALLYREACSILPRSPLGGDPRSAGRRDR